MLNAIFEIHRTNKAMSTRNKKIKKHRETNALFLEAFVDSVSAALVGLMKA